MAEETLKKRGLSSPNSCLYPPTLFVPLAVTQEHHKPIYTTPAPRKEKKGGAEGEGGKCTAKKELLDCCDVWCFDINDINDIDVSPGEREKKKKAALGIKEVVGEVRGGGHTHTHTTRQL